MLLALVATGASPTSAATLGVDDSSSTGAVGDARLSLSEAIRLAGGQLSPLDLSAAERARIDGDPGASSRDLIRVELGEASILTTPAGAAVGLPPLIGNEGDVLDGGGATLRAAGALPPAAIGLLAISSKIEVRRFSFDGYPLGLVVAEAPQAAALEEIRISENGFSNYESGVVVAPNSEGSKGLRSLRIDGNRFAAGAKATNAIVVLGASPRAPGAVARDYVVEDIVIRKNEVRGGFGGIAVFGGMAEPGTTVRDGRLDGLRIVENDLRGVFDLSIAVSAGFANRGGVVSGIEVSGVHIAGNHIATAGTPSTHIWAVAGATVFEPGGLVEDNLLRDVGIVGNSSSGGGDCVGGIQLQAGHDEIGGGTVRGNRLEHAWVFANSVADCENGLALFGGVAAAGHGLVEGNELRQVLLFGNRLEGNEHGVSLSGGVGLEGSAHPLPSPEPGTIRQNLVRSLGVVRNRMRGGVDGIIAVGGISSFTSDAVTGNSVSNAREVGNVVRDADVRCAAIDDILLGDEGGAAADNRAAFGCSEGRPRRREGP